MAARPRTDTGALYDAAGVQPRLSPVPIALAVFLGKLAKHLALLACLGIIGNAGSRFAMAPPMILGLVILAAAAHALGGSFSLRQRRSGP